MEMKFLSRLTPQQVSAVHKKKLHYQDRKYYLSGEITTETFSFTVGSFQKKGEAMPRFTFRGSITEVDGKALFSGDLSKTELTKKADKITAFTLTALIGALMGILVQTFTGKWYFSVAAFFLGAGLGVLSHWRSTKKEIKAFAAFFIQYMKKIFRADETK